MIRYASYFIAVLLPLLLFRWFAPASIGEIDFWLLWLLAMVLVALPVVYAEIALAYRSVEGPLAGMQKLTRESDASPIWRSFGWLAALVSIVIAALIISGASTGILTALTELNSTPDVPSFAVAAGLMVITVLLSLLGVAPLPIGLGLMVVGLILGIANGVPNISFAMTDISLVEWARAVALALVSVGAGTGLYWFGQNLVSRQTVTAVEASSQQAQSRAARDYRATKLVLPIWILQVLVGVVALFISGMSLPPIGQLLYWAGVLFVVSYLLHYSTQQLAHKFGLLVSLIITFVLALLLVVAIPTTWLVGILVIVSSIAVLLLSVFAGWQMKISHLRKSLNFSSEAFYNLWRVAIRLVVPLALLLALIGWVIQWLS
ncbi:membrane protein [Psychrobacter pacificensis]|nr:membrane protein [Psychrobacter pacificensis]|tara:strand:+ start:1749 stop:2876 length:1128 start_codon:yes stop_codon:yes gene_type:complete